MDANKLTMDNTKPITENEEQPTVANEVENDNLTAEVTNPRSPEILGVADGVSLKTLDNTKEWREELGKGEKGKPQAVEVGVIGLTKSPGGQPVMFAEVVKDGERQVISHEIDQKTLLKAQAVAGKNDLAFMKIASDVFPEIEMKTLVGAKLGNLGKNLLTTAAAQVGGSLVQTAMAVNEVKTARGVNAQQVVSVLDAKAALDLRATSIASELFDKAVDTPAEDKTIAMGR